MLRLVAYDIAEPKRWRRVYDACEDYGVRVQYSLFECWLEEPVFARFWARLQKCIDPQQDRLVAYTLDAAAARQRRVAGAMQCTEQPRWYIV